MTEHIIIHGKPEPYDRWQHLEDVAYMIDGARRQEVELLSALLESFPECSPSDDWPGYAVRHLLVNLLENRRGGGKPAFVGGIPNIPNCNADPAHCKGGHWGAGGYLHFAPIGRPERLAPTIADDDGFPF